MSKMLKKWIRRHRRSRRRDDFSDDVRRAERKKKRRKSSSGWLSKAIKFREPSWAKSRPMTRRDKRQPLDRGSYFNPLVWIWGLFRFIGSWIASRPYGSLLPAVPALAVIIGVIGLVIWYRSAGRSWREKQYRIHLSTAVQKQDYPVAMVSVNTLIDQNSLDPELQYQRAVIADEMDQPQLSSFYMQQLAAGDYVPAILWLLKRDYNDGPVSTWEADKQAKYLYYLTKLRRHARGDNLQLAKKLMGIYLANMGLKSEAAEQFAELAGEQPDLLLGLALLHEETGDHARARGYARDAQSYLSSVLTQDPTNVSARMQLAQSFILDENWDKSIHTLQEGLKLTPGNERLVAGLADAYAGASLRLGKPDRLNPEIIDQRFAYAVAALKTSPGSPRVLDAVQKILAETRDHEDKVELRDSLYERLTPEMSHFVSGTLALLDDNVDDAIKHLRLAQKHGLNAPGILNNLAVATSAQKDADLDEALRLADAALEMLPDHPYLLETRGQILLKMERYEDAITDLEKSLGGVQQSELKLQIYPSLIKAFQALGLDETAEKYQRMADLTEAVVGSKTGTSGPAGPGPQ